MSDIRYRRLNADEAPQLIDLIRRCYGESYPYGLFYDRDELYARLSDERLISAVAENSSGELIGHVATQWPYLGAPVAEAMTGIVLSQYQRQGVLAQLTRTMGQLFDVLKLTGLQLYSVTTHSASQRNGLDRGAIECGFLVPDFPNSMEADGVEHEQLGERNPALVMYCPINTAPDRQCFIPACYRELIHSIYQSTGYPRTLTTAPPAEHSTQPSHCSLHADQKKGVDTLLWHSIGADWQQEIGDFLAAAANGPSHLGWYMDIPLNQGRAIEVIEYLQTAGWYFGALLFERAEGDVLRMQFCRAEIHPERLEIASDKGKAIMNFVLKEREKRAGKKAVEQ